MDDEEEGSEKGSDDERFHEVEEEVEEEVGDDVEVEDDEAEEPPRCNRKIADGTAVQVQRRKVIGTSPAP